MHKVLAKHAPATGMRHDCNVLLATSHTFNHHQWPEQPPWEASISHHNGNKNVHHARI